MLADHSTKWILHMIPPLQLPLLAFSGLEATSRALPTTFTMSCSFGSSLQPLFSAGLCRFMLEPIPPTPLSLEPSLERSRNGSMDPLGRVERATF